MSTQETISTTPAAGQLQTQAKQPSRRTGFRYFIKRFARENPLNVVALGILTIFFLLCIFGPTIAPHNPTQPEIEIRLTGPSSSHWLGTDQLGRDVLSRIMAGARISLGIATLILAIAIPVGTLVG